MSRRRDRDGHGYHARPCVPVVMVSRSSLERQQSGSSSVQGPDDQVRFETDET